ncbi:MAG: hypothetical protein SOU50_05745 [Oscillospiraceae bacterium]|nr:hypothetical protein [Oscillospiraceae bacterium]MDY2847704.1 hypothetical protein [Oscillospiraceae bacterium]
METIKSIILSACFISIISAALGMAAPDGKCEGHLKLILGAIFIITAASGLMKGDFSDLTEISAGSAVIAENTAASADDYFISAAEANLDRTLEKYLKEKGVSGAEVSSVIDISENGSIYINEVTASLSDYYSDYVCAVEALKNAVGEDVTIYVKRQADENG